MNKIIYLFLLISINLFATAKKPSYIFLFVDDEGQYCPSLQKTDDNQKKFENLKKEFKIKDVKNTCQKSMKYFDNYPETKVIYNSGTIERTDNKKTMNAIDLIKPYYKKWFINDNMLLIKFDKNLEISPNDIKYCFYNNSEKPCYNLADLKDFSVEFEKDNLILFSSKFHFVNGTQKTSYIEVKKNTINSIAVAKNENNQTICLKPANKILTNLKLNIFYKDYKFQESILNNDYCFDMPEFQTEDDDKNIIFKTTDDKENIFIKNEIKLSNKKAVNKSQTNDKKFNVEVELKTLKYELPSDIVVNENNELKQFIIFEKFKEYSMVFYPVSNKTGNKKDYLNMKFKFLKVNFENNIEIENLFIDEKQKEVDCLSFKDTSSDCYLIKNTSVKYFSDEQNLNKDKDFILVLNSNNKIQQQVDKVCVANNNIFIGFENESCYFKNKNKSIVFSASCYKEKLKIDDKTSDINVALILPESELKKINIINKDNKSIKYSKTEQERTIVIDCD